MATWTRLRGTHPPVECWQSRHTYYCYKSYGASFACGVCGRTRRWNLNYLGRRIVYCDGGQFAKAQEG